MVSDHRSRQALCLYLRYHRSLHRHSQSRSEWRVGAGDRRVTGAEGEPILADGDLVQLSDNAPTYLVFFNTAGGDPVFPWGHFPEPFGDIGEAVFMGANTYIGNAPNYMVKSIAEERGIEMPSFLAICGGRL